MCARARACTQPPYANRWHHERVLACSQHCFWLGTPIGLHNRKYFVLFVTYSAIFCLMGSVHSWYELSYAMPLRLGYPPFPWRNVRALPWSHEASGTWAALTYNVLEWLIGGACASSLTPFKMSS